MTSKRGLGIFEQSNAFSVTGEHWTAKYFNIVIFQSVKNIFPFPEEWALSINLVEI
jgi:hypothetical protein